MKKKEKVGEMDQYKYTEEFRISEEIQSRSRDDILFACTRVWPSNESTSLPLSVFFFPPLFPAGIKEGGNGGGKEKKGEKWPRSQLGQDNRKL